MLEIEDWLGLEYPESKFDQVNVSLKIQCVMSYLDTFYGGNGENLVLDIGCGSGAFSSGLAKRKYKIVGLDISATAIKKARDYFAGSIDNLYLIVGDATNPPFREGTFDVILCSEVMEHLILPEQGVKVIRGLLRENGLALITVPWLWEICSNTRMAVANRLLDHIYSSKDGLLAKLAFSSVGDRPEELVFRKYIPAEYSVYARRLGRRVNLKDYLLLNRSQEYLGHKHWFTPGEWKRLIEANGFTILDWKGSKIIPRFAVEPLERVIERSLPQKLKRWLGQIIIIAAR